MDFVNLKDYLTIQYEVICDGVTVEQGVIEDPEILDLPAHEEKVIPVSLEIPKQGKCFLKVTYLLKEATEVLPAGFTLGFEEVQAVSLKNENQKVTELLWDTSEHVEFEVIEDDCSLTISTPKFSYRYDKLKGVFSEMVYQNHSLLECPMEFNIWRAPTDNDNDMMLGSKGYFEIGDCASCTKLGQISACFNGHERLHYTQFLCILTFQNQKTTF